MYFNLSNSSAVISLLLLVFNSNGQLNILPTDRFLNLMQRIHFTSTRIHAYHPRNRLRYKTVILHFPIRERKSKLRGAYIRPHFTHNRIKTLAKTFKTRRSSYAQNSITLCQQSPSHCLPTPPTGQVFIV